MRIVVQYTRNPQTINIYLANCGRHKRLITWNAGANGVRFIQTSLAGNDFYHGITVSSSWRKNLRERVASNDGNAPHRGETISSEDSLAPLSPYGTRRRSR